MSYPSSEDDSSACRYCCCWWCLQYCCPMERKAEKYPHVKYKPPQQATAITGMPEIQQVPLEKIFKFPQHQREFPVHPQLLSKEGVVTTQPKSTASSAQRQKGSADTQVQRMRSVSPRGDVHIAHVSDRYRTASVSPPRSPSQAEDSPSRPRSRSLQVSPQAPFLTSRSSTPSFGSRSPSPGPYIKPAPLSKQRRWLTVSRSPSPEPVPRHKLMTTAEEQSKTRKDSGDQSVGSEDSTGEFPVLAQTIHKSASFDVHHFQTQTSAEEADLSPVLEFCLYLDIQRRTLTVNLRRASNLPEKTGGRLRDPFVMLFLLPNKEVVFQTEVVNQTLDPVFDAHFEFQGILSHEVRQQVLLFQVFDGSKNSFVGSVEQPLNEAELFGVCMRRNIDQKDSSLRPQTKGDLLLSLQFSPRVSILQGIVLKVTNIAHAHFYKMPDPYVKLHFLYKGKRVHKWKTSVQKNTLIPVFNEPFKIDISRMDIRDVIMEAFVMDHDRFYRNTVVGMVTLGSNVSDESGKAHWLEMLSSPRQQVSHWHPIMDPARKSSLEKVKTL